MEASELKAVNSTQHARSREGALAGCTDLVVDVFGWISSVDSVTFGPVKEVDLDGTAVPQADAIADVTGDGRPDLIEESHDNVAGTSSVVVYPGTGSGLGRAKSYPSDATFGLYSMAVGDLDGDGLADVVVATDAGVDLYLQRSGKLTKKKLLRTGRVPDVEIVDIDGNGDPDLVFGGGGWIDDVLHPDVKFLSGIPAGSPRHFGDVTDDGLPDFVAAASPYQIVVSVQQPGLTFAAPITVMTSPVGHPIGDLAVGDVTGDGRDLSVYPGLALARINSDDRLDVVAANGGITAGDVYIQGDTGLAGPLALSDPTGGGYEPDSVAVGDLNGDGLPDIAFANTDGRFRFAYQQ